MYGRLRYTHLSKAMSAARRSLMLPHLDGEARAIADALSECELGLHNFPDILLDDAARASAATVRIAMSTEGVPEDAVNGSLFRKAEMMNLDEKIILSRAVDELASWADRMVWEND